MLYYLHIESAPGCKEDGGDQQNEVQKRYTWVSCF